MAIWPFNKKKLDQAMLPDEVSEYYKDENDGAGRPGWISALITIAVTALLAIVLFFGGRWVYQSIFGNNDNQSENQATTEQEKADEVKPADQNDSTDSANNSDSTENDNGSSADQTPSSSTESESTPTTGATEIPDTGPGPGGLQ